MHSLEGNSSRYRNKCKLYFSLRQSGNEKALPRKHTSIIKTGRMNLSRKYPTNANQQTKKAAYP